MKKVTLLALVALMTMGLRAQVVTESVASVGNLTVPACTLTLEKDAKTVQNAMNQYLKDLKLKTQKQEGYVVALNTFVETIASSPINLYTKVEEQGKKKNRTTVVTACALSTDLTVDQSTLRENVKTWLTSFVDYINRYETLQQLEQQEENLKKVEKVQKAVASDVAGIAKSIASDQSKLADKQKELQKLQLKVKDLEKEISALESSIEKSNQKKNEAEQKLEEANQKMNEAQGEVDAIRQMIQ